MSFQQVARSAQAVERIADAAGFSKGAVYSNFESKEAIFLEVLEAEGQESLNELIEAIGRASKAEAVVELLVAWANERSQSGSWSLTILEHARTVPRGSPSLKRQEEIIRNHWRQLGECLIARFPRIEEDSEMIGALLHEIAYAPAMTFVSRPTAGDLMRLAMEKMLVSCT